MNLELSPVCGRTVARAAQSFIGTSFRHRGRLPGSGLDCAGVVVAAYRHSGWSTCPDISYPARPVNGELIGLLRREFETSKCEIGGIVYVPIKGAEHCGLITSPSTFVSVFQDRKVEQYRLSSWAAAIRGYFIPRQGLLPK